MTSEPALSLLLRITLLLAIGLLVDRCLRRRILALAAFWNALILALAVLPLAALLIVPTSLPILPAEPLLGEDPMAVREFPDPVVGEAVLAMDEADQRAATSAEPKPPTLTVGSVARWIYAFGVAIALLRLLADWRAVAALRRQATRVTSPRWIERLGDRLTKAEPPLTGPVELLASEAIDVPLAVGVRSPAIMLPASMVATATATAIDATLIHELAHIRRADCAWQLLQRLVEAALWFHPLMWLAHRRIAFIRERACDEYSVHALGDADAYAETLLDIAAARSRRRTLGFGMAVVRSRGLAARLSALEQSAGNRRCIATRLIRASLASATVLGAALSTAFVIGPAAAQPSSSVDETARPEDAGKAPQPDAEGEKRPDIRIEKINVSGRALDDARQPIAGATIFLVTSSGLPNSVDRSTKTDAEGRYEFRDYPLPVAARESDDHYEGSTIHLFGKAPGHAVAWRGERLVYWRVPQVRAGGNGRFANPELPGEEDIVLDLKFARPKQVAGRMLDEQGRPIAGLKVELAGCEFLDPMKKEMHGYTPEFPGSNQRAKPLMPEVFFATTDAEGRFAFESVPVEAICIMRAKHPDFGSIMFFTAASDQPPATFRGFAGPEPVLPLPVEIKLRRLREVTVKVVHESTVQPAAGARVDAHAWQGARVASDVEADAAGVAVLRLPPGTYGLTADPGRDSNADCIRTRVELVVEEPANPQPVKLLALKPGAIVILKAVDADTGAPIAGIPFWEAVDFDTQKGVPGARIQTHNWVADNPVTNDKGELRAVVVPGKRAYGVDFYTVLVVGYDVIGEDFRRGRELELTAGETTRAEFRIRKKTAK